MLAIKYISILLILIISVLIGYLLSKKCTNRVRELKDMQNAINILENKITYTYEPLPEIFLQISDLMKNNIGNIFKETSKRLKKQTIDTAWNDAIANSNTNLNNEDYEILKTVSRLLGKTDKDGQVSQLKLSSTFLGVQIKKAEEDDNKNSKMYKTLGTVIGFAIAIVLI